MTPTELRMGLPWGCGAHRTDGCVVVSYSPSDEEAFSHVQMLIDLLGEPWKRTHNSSNATAWFPIERFELMPEVKA